MTKQTTLAGLRKEFKRENADYFFDADTMDHNVRAIDDVWEWIESKLKQQRAEVLEEEKKKRHNWVVNKGITKYAYCEKCGYMMKYKDNDWDCPGMAEVTMRNQLNTPSGDTKEVEK